MYISSTMSLHDCVVTYIVPGKKVSRPLGVSLRGGAQFLSGNTKMFLEGVCIYIHVHSPIIQHACIIIHTYMYM